MTIAGSMWMAAQGENARLDALTGLRFFAAFAILIHHATFFNVHVKDVLFGHGVSFFFVLSGFILAWVHPTIESRQAAKLFIWDRIARIWPVHFATLLLTLVLLGGTIFKVRFILTAAMLHGWIPLERYYFGYNPPSWSISTELGFYLCFPFLIHNWSRTWWWKLLLTFGVVMATIGLCTLFGLGGYQPNTFSAHGLVYISPLGRIFEFTVGIACCSVYRWVAKRPRLGLAAGTALELAALAALAWTMTGGLLRLLWPYGSAAMNEWLGHTSSLPACAFAVVVFACGSGVVSKVLASPPLRRLGEISYSLYLVHAPIYLSYTYAYPSSPGQVDWVSWGFCLAASFVGAYLLWRFVEIPGRRVIRAYARNRLQPDKPALQPAT